MGRNVDNIGGLAQAAANVASPINRRNMRFLDGGGITWSVVDDPGNNEVEVSAVASGASAAPVGALMSFAGTTVPPGWLECDGTSYTTASQPALFAAIGYDWGGAGPNFNVPDFRRRTPVGRGGVGTGTLGSAVGNVGGAETHALSVGEMPSHGHTHDVWNTVPWGNTFMAPFGGNGLMTTNFAGFTNINAGGTIYNNGGSGAHNNMQPSAVVMVIIKA